MNRCRALIALALAVLGVALPAVIARDAPPSPSARMAVPPLDEAGLPPLPGRSPRNASYTIAARLDAERHLLDGHLDLQWRNTTGLPQSTFPFHLYWNAFRNNLSTTARGASRRVATADDPRRWGYTHVSRVAVAAAGAAEADLTPTIRYVQPDDGNADDRTVMEVTTPAPVPPEATVTFRVDWRSQIPYGDVGRAGWVHDFHFIAQWFPKIGVFWNGAWNAHQFHPTTEFFSDYGVYDVALTVPDGYVVGATGALVETTDQRSGPEAARTFRFHQDDVHDFAWTASRRFLERRGRFEAAGYPPVDIRLLVQPEHEFLAERYIEAARVALKGYGAWSAPYPYAQLTVVDPAWGSASGGMEYPTLITGGAGIWAPPALYSPESVTVHEAGHQFWYGLIGTNEFEEPWLDEGFNRYHDRKAYALAYGPRGYGTRYFGLRGRGASGFPVVAPGVDTGRSGDILDGLRAHGREDVMARRSWDFVDSESYGLNAYGKPALSLQTLEGLLGDETMTRVLRTYARRHRFSHPGSATFIATVNEVTGQDWRWYFDQTWYSAEECDYAVSVKNVRERTAKGYLDGPAGPVLPSPPAGSDDDDDDDDDSRPYESEVTVRRLGGVRLPVELRVDFEDGRSVRETWDGQYRWTRFRYHGPSPVVAATLDPEGRIALDVDPSNNGWVEEKGQSRRAAVKWATRWMFWFQHLLEMHAVLG